MIAKAAPARRSGRGSFCDLREYLERDGQGYEREDLLGTWSGNVAAHATADLEMERVAARGRATDPIFHVILSWRPGEDVSAETVRGAIDATLESMGAERRQWFAAAHLDPETQRTHLHLVINKIDTRTHKALDRSWFHAKLARAAEWIEREYGCLTDRRMDWRAFEMAERNYGSEVTPDRTPEPDHEPPRNLALVPEGAKTAEMDAALRAGYSWARLVREEAIPAAQTAATGEGASWERVHATLETYGLRMIAKGSGARLVGVEPGLHLKASRAGLDVGEMAKTLGPFREPDRTQTPHDERLLHARRLTAGADSWPELHANLAEIGLAIDAGRGGPGGDLRGRVVDLEFDGRKTAARMALGESLSSLEKRLGAYEVAPEIVAREARESERHEETVAARVALLIAEPQIVVERVAAMRSTWDRSDVAREVRTILDLDDGKAWTADVDRVVAAALAPIEETPDALVTGTASVTGDLIPNLAPAIVSFGIARDEDGSEREIFSTTAIVADERAMHAAARALAEREPDEKRAELRAPSAELDDQQRGAYAEIASGKGLAIVQGIAGAGKSRMLRDVAAAYAGAGYRVVGAAVSGDAARVLGEEAKIDTQTVARLRINLDRGRERLDEKTVLLIDEASMLGTSDARELLEAARDGGATVRFLGDAEQHGSVARGNVLADLSDAHGSVDMATSRRAQEPWLRAVAADLRRGATTRALGELREHGCIAEHRTTDEAKATLIDGWARDVRADRDVLLIATRRTDVADLNDRARAALADRLGEKRAYTTAFGEREVAVGELLVARVSDRKSETVNGDRLRVVAHGEDGRLSCERVRDGASVTWDVQKKPEIDYGYASTSYRSQGSTVDAVYVLASSADDRRGLYVDATRARETVRIAYGRDEIANFGAVLALGAQDRIARSVTGVERAVTAYEQGRSPEAPPTMPEAEPRKVEPPAQETTPVPNEAKPEPAPVADLGRLVPVESLRLELSQRMGELRARDEAGRRLTESASTPGAPGRDERAPATTAEEIVARRLEIAAREVARAEAAAERQRREKNQGFLTLTRSPLQRSRDTSTAAAYEDAVTREERERAVLSDPVTVAEMQRTLDRAREARQEIRRTTKARENVATMFRELRAVGITEIRMREREESPAAGIEERLRTITANVRETYAAHAPEIAERRTIEHERDRAYGMER